MDGVDRHERRLRRSHSLSSEVAALTDWILRVGCIAAAMVLSVDTSASLLGTFDNPTPTDGDYFGGAVAVDGDQLLVAEDNDSSNGGFGAAHLFDATTGDLRHTFPDPTPADDGTFGDAIAIDGNQVIIGEPRDSSGGFRVGRAHLYDATTGTLIRSFDDPTPTTSDLFGMSVATDEGRVLIGAPLDDTQGSNVGQAHLFDAVSGDLLWTFNDPTITDRDYFGSAVAIDGNLVLVGSHRDDTYGSDVGQAHLFDVTTGVLIHTFNDPMLTGSDAFGFSVAIEGDRVLIGARSRNGVTAGQVHLFDATTGRLLRTLNDPTTYVRDPSATVHSQFGYAVAMDGGYIVIGEHADDTNGIDVGQVHLFDAATGILLQTFDDPSITDRDEFGASVSIDGSFVAVGARYDDTYGRSVGQAHLFSTTPLDGLPGDFNQDGRVDASDYTVWRDTLNGSGEGLPADANGDGAVNLADHAYWAANYGADLPTTAVPEPASAISIVVALGSYFTKRP